MSFMRLLRMCGNAIMFAALEVILWVLRPAENIGLLHWLFPEAKPAGDIMSIYRNENDDVVVVDENGHKFIRKEFRDKKNRRHIKFFDTN